MRTKRFVASGGDEQSNIWPELSRTSGPLDPKFVAGWIGRKTMRSLDYGTTRHPPKGLPSGWTEDEWKTFVAKPKLGPPPGKQLPTAGELFGPKPSALPTLLAN